MPRAAVLTAPHRIDIQQRQALPLRPGEARVQIQLAGVCGTDLAIYSGDYPVPLPLVLGHEWCGQVIETGPGVSPAWNGTRVIGEINNHCRARRRRDPCALCVLGHPNHCLERSVTGIVGHDGALQEELVLPADNLFRVPERINANESVLIEPLAAALRTFDLSPIEPGDQVVVLGAGRLGLLTALVAKALGAQVLCATRTTRRDPSTWGLERILWNLEDRQAPRDPLAPAASPLLEQVLARSEGRGADLVIEATGTPQGLVAATDLVRPRGTIALKSTPGLSSPGLPLTRLVVHEVRLQGSRCGSFARALEFQARHGLPLQKLVSARFPLTRLEDALAAARTESKVLIEVAGDRTP